MFKDSLNREFPEGEPRKIRLDVAPLSADDFDHFMAAINSSGMDALSSTLLPNEPQSLISYSSGQRRCASFVGRPICRTRSSQALQRVRPSHGGHAATEAVRAGRKVAGQAANGNSCGTITTERVPLFQLRLTALVGTGKHLKELLEQGMTTELARETQELIFKKASSFL